MRVDTHNKKDEEFLRIYHALKEKVFRVSMHYSYNNYSLAEDITNEVFEILYRHFDTIDKERITRWLMTTARNATINAMKKASWELLDENIDLTVDLNVSEESAEDVYMRRFNEEETKFKSDTILGKLYEVNERWYTAVTMVYIMGKKQKDVADEMGISPEVLNSVLYRARKWIREHDDFDNEKE
ncbi:sigma-70 family RNA polymerase sigma factor [Roseburia hominis]